MKARFAMAKNQGSQRRSVARNQRHTNRAALLATTVPAGRKLPGGPSKKSFSVRGKVSVGGRTGVRSHGTRNASVIPASHTKSPYQLTRRLNPPSNDQTRALGPRPLAAPTSATPPIPRASSTTTRERLC